MRTNSLNLGVSSNDFIWNWLLFDLALLGELSCGYWLKMCTLEIGRLRITGMNMMSSGLKIDISRVNELSRRDETR